MCCKTRTLTMMHKRISQTSFESSTVQSINWTQLFMAVMLLVVDSLSLSPSALLIRFCFIFLISLLFVTCAEHSHSRWTNVGQQQHQEPEQFQMCASSTATHHINICMCVDDAAAAEKSHFCHVILIVINGLPIYLFRRTKKQQQVCVCVYRVCIEKRTNE